MNKNVCVFKTNGGIATLSFPDITALGCNHGFSTRTGGVSGVPFDSLNMGFNRPEPRENILENYARFAKANGLDMNSFVLAAYEHGLNVEIVDSSDCGRGFLPDKPALPPCDGLVTDDPNVTLLTLHADCQAYFVFDPKHRAIGLAHAGWRGVLGRIGRNLITKMQNCYGSDPADIIVGIGPGICPRCFEVGDDVLRMFESEYGESVISGSKFPDKGYVDLVLSSRLQFRDCGVPPHSIFDSGYCTYEHPEYFFSYRRDSKQWEKTGAMCAYMALAR